MWSASAELGLRSPLLLYWSLIPHAGQCVMPMACARASTCFLNCLCSLVLVLLTAFLSSASVCVVCLCVVLGGGASQRQRDERLRRLTLLSSSCLPFSFLLVFLCLWKGVCRVVRAQPCEHARDTTHALCALWVCLPRVLCVTSTTTRCLLFPPHTVHC